MIAAAAVVVARGGQGERQMCRAVQDVVDAVAAAVLLATVLVEVVIGLHQRGQRRLRHRLVLELGVRGDRITGRADTAITRRGRRRVRRSLKVWEVVVMVVERTLVVVMLGKGAVHVGLGHVVGRVDGGHSSPGREIRHRLLRLRVRGRHRVGRH